MSPSYFERVNYSMLYVLVNVAILSINMFLLIQKSSKNLVFMMSLKTLVIIEFQVVLANYIKIFF